MCAFPFPRWGEWLRSSQNRVARARSVCRVDKDEANEMDRTTHDTSSWSEDSFSRRFLLVALAIALACFPASITVSAQSFAGYPATTQLTGTVTVSAGTGTVVGTGTAFTTELNVGDAILIDTQWLTIQGISTDTLLTLRGTHTAGAAGVTAFTTGWPETFCPANGPFTDCWVTIPRFGVGVSDFNESGGGSDTSKKTTPSPPENDLFQGREGDTTTGAPDGQITTMFAYKPAEDVVFLRMRLDEEPTSAVNTSSDPGTQPKGPFKDNTAWNFIFDFNGDGWADIVATTDGNSGATGGNSNTDDIQLAWVNSPGDQSFDNTAPLCIDPSGEILYRRKANVSPFSLAIPGCDEENDPLCDFVFSRVLNECAATNPAANCTTDGTNFFLDMQFPRGAFDDCLTPGDPDMDGVGGDQYLEIDTPFVVCVTTSTQPNNFTNKDLALEAEYSMDQDKPLPCSDPCTLSTGCSQVPVLFDISASCGAGTNSSPITLTAQVVDTGGLTGSPPVVTDSLAQVEFFYVQEDGMGGVVGNWQSALPDTGSSNPVTSPGAEINLWSMDWDTSSLPTSPSVIYHVQAEITDDQGNVSYGIYSVDLTNCNTNLSTPVTLSSFTSAALEGGAELRWETATEAGNAGFNLYARTRNGWQRINSELIPSHVVDSTEPQQYRFVLDGVSASAFAIEDVDIEGRSKLRGPFALGEHYGRRFQATEIDWVSVRAQHEGKGSARPGLRGAAASPAFQPAGDQLASRVAGKGGGKYPAVDLLVDRDGLYRVTYESLAAAGFDFHNASSKAMALLRQGVPVPIRVEAGKRFGPGSFVEFFGEAAESLYTDTMVYRLVVEQRSALRIPLDTTPLKPTGGAPVSYQETAAFENQRQYSFGAPGNDPWFDTRMLAFTGLSQYSFDFSIDDFAAGAAPSALSVRVWGVTNWPRVPDHHLEVDLNGTPVAARFFDGREQATITATLPPGVLREGGNTLTLKLPGDTGVSFDLINLDAYSVEYPRSFRARNGRLEFTAPGPWFRVTGLDSDRVLVYRIDGETPSQLEDIRVENDGGSWSVSFPGRDTSSAYLVSTLDQLRTPGLRAARPAANITSGRAEYLIVSHPDFIDGLAPLVAARKAEGFSVRVVDVEDVYAQFSHGVFDAHAIREYVALAASRMGTRFLLLVGGDTYDYKNYLELDSVSFIPSLYVSTGPIVTFAPADPLYGDVDGDQIPDVAVGRFPVRSSEDLAAVIDKTLQYASKSYGRTAVLAADFKDASADVSFRAQSENFTRHLSGWDVSRAYMDVIGPEEARNLLINSLERGVALASFVGHSGPTLWTFSNLFSSTDAMQLANLGSPAAVLQWGCWNTYHVEPRYETLGHALLLQRAGAAIVLGSTTLTDAPSASALSHWLEPLLVEPGGRIGEALTSAKQSLAQDSPELLDVILGWSILGDPALVIEP